MARPPIDSEAAADLGRRLSALKSEYERTSGPLSFDRIARTVESEWSVQISAAYCSRFHRGDNDPRTSSSQHLTALCLFYDVSPSALGSVVSERLAHERALLQAMRPDVLPAGQERGAIVLSERAPRDR